MTDEPTIWRNATARSQTYPPHSRKTTARTHPALHRSRQFYASHTVSKHSADSDGAIPLPCTKKRHHAKRYTSSMAHRSSSSIVD